GVSDKFKNNQKSWRFIQGGFKFEDETNPWLNNGWPEFIHVDNLQGEVKDNNFMAIKIGDINYTAKTNLALASQSRTAGRIYFELEDKSLLPGDQMRIPVFGSWNNRISGFQLSWKYNPNVLEVVSVQSGQAIITEGNYSLLEGEKGILSMSWNGNDPIKASSNLPLFYIIVKSNHTINPANDFTVANSGIEVEAYTDELEILDIQLRDRSSHKELVKFELFQNTPNPFGDKTNIAFYTPVQSSALIKIHDLSGRLLLVKQIKTSVGVNNVQIDQNEFSNHSGVYYYTLETSEFVATKKMILSK
ncbi:MAG TPA: T9SS type A sorting domain-containing protein, partial [Saprospiraceae bacterium]|nr:T9SS type A sorting domain-containing protein [Saprospiraceae bacterium]